MMCFGFLIDSEKQVQAYLKKQGKITTGGYMKKFWMIATLFIIPLFSLSQDIIYKKEGGKIQSKVVSIENGIIFYQLYQTRDNSVKQIPVAEVSMIDYEEEGIVFNQDLTNTPSISGKDPTARAQRTEEKEQMNERFNKIIKKDGETIRAVDVDIFPEVVKFRYSNQPDGPLRNLPREDIAKILDPDGQEKSFPGKTYAEKEETAGETETSFSDKGSPEAISGSGSPGTSFRLGTGYGNSYGGAGVKAQLLFGENNFKIGIHGGAGYYFEEPNPAAQKVLSYSAGLQLYFLEGLYLNAQYGGLGIYRQAVVKPNTSLVSYQLSPLEGVSLLGGYDLKIARKLAFNMAGGVCYDLNGGQNTYPAFDLGIMLIF